MKKIFTLLSILTLTLTFNSCNEEIETSDLKYATFAKTQMNVGVPDGAEKSTSLTIYTTNITSSDRQFDVKVLDTSTANAAFYTVSSTVTIPSGTNQGKLDLKLTDGTWLNSDQSLTLRLSSSSDDAEQSVGQDSNLTLYRLCPGATETKVKFEIKFDSYPEEVYWRIRNSSGVTVRASQASPGFGAYAGMTGSFVEGFCLEAGDYQFSIFDQFRDGAGAVSIQNYDGITLVSSDGKYGAGTTINFTVN